LRRFLIFCAVGGVNSAASYAVYWMLLHVAAYLYAYTIAYVFGLALSYVLNARLVFGRRLESKTAITFPLVYVVQYVLGMLLLPMLVQFAALSAPVAGAVTMVALAPVTFVAAQINFRRGEPREPRASPPRVGTDRPQ
jgi:putative flippase GtrA